MRKFLKAIALLLSFVLLAGAVCSCASNDLTVSDSSESSAEDVTSESSGTVSDALPDTSDTISDNVSPDVSDEESAEESDVSEDGQGGETSQPEEVQKPDDNTPKYDIVVYGDTAAAVVSAVAASRQGAKVALVAPNKHLGGMMSGGLFETDLGNSSVIGGMSREFFKRNAVIKGNKRSMEAISASFAVTPERRSVTRMITSALSIAMFAWVLILERIPSSVLGSIPPVSTSITVWLSHSHSQ